MKTWCTLLPPAMEHWRESILEISLSFAWKDCCQLQTWTERIWFHWEKPLLWRLVVTAKDLPNAHTQALDAARQRNALVSETVENVTAAATTVSHAETKCANENVLLAFYDIFKSTRNEIVCPIISGFLGVCKNRESAFLCVTLLLLQMEKNQTFFCSLF